MGQILPFFGLKVKVSRKITFEIPQSKENLALNSKFSNKNDLLWTIKNFVIDIDITNDTLSRKFHP